jgi:diguanylate cyclase (GGDEF)-like protein/PAS domain S-box-containing protein
VTTYVPNLADGDDLPELRRLQEQLSDSAADMRDSVARMQRLIDALPEAALLIDPHHHAIVWPIIHCNAAAGKISGYQADELRNQSINLLRQAPLDAAHRQALLDELRRHEVLQQEVYNRRRDGSLVPVAVQFSLIAAGDRELVLCVERDIFVQRSTEAALRRRIAGEQCVSAISQQFIALPPHAADSGVSFALSTLGGFMAADRVFLQIFDEQQLAGRSGAWEAFGVEPIDARPAAAAAYTALWAINQLQHGEPIRVSAGTAPDEAQRILALRGARSCLVIPLLRGESLVGCFGVEAVRADRSWAETDLLILTMVGDVIVRVLSNQRRAAQLHASEERYRRLAEHATDVIASVDRRGICRYCSPATRALLGYEPSELVGRQVWDLIDADDQQLLWLQFRRLLRFAEPATVAFRIRHAQGHSLWFETSLQPIVDPANGRVREVICVSRDISTRQAYQMQIERLAFFDSLTGLANRRRLQISADQALAEAAQTGGALGLLYLDLDRFKYVNDTLGHDAGDELLVQVAARLRANTRADDTVARLGGDEFMVLLPGRNREQAAQVAQRILEQIERPFSLRGRVIHLGVSIGIAGYPEDGATVDDLMRYADIAMYRAKDDGNTYALYDVSLSAYAQTRMQIESELRQAIGADELLLHYQPILDLATDTVVGVEALIRWQHPQRGLLAPDAFVPIAEEIGLIRVIDRWVLRAGMQQLATWHAAGRMLHLTMNISVLSLHDRDLISYVASCLTETGAPAESITIEVTESASMRDPEMTARLLAQLKELGMRLALDDFGSGHASLNYLKRLPIDEVKIDRSFVEGLGHDARDEGVVEAILALGRALGLVVVAEGVTAEVQRAWLKAAGCHMAQGYGIGYPVAHEAM